MRFTRTRGEVRRPRFDNLDGKIFEGVILKNALEGEALATADSSDQVSQLQDELQHWGRYLVSADEYPLLLSALLPYLHEFAWICAWKRSAPNTYRLKFSTLDPKLLSESLQQKMNSVISTSYQGIVNRTAQSLYLKPGTTAFEPVTLNISDLKVEDDLATTVCLVLSSNQETLLEIYLKNLSNSFQPTLIRSMLDIFYSARAQALVEYQSAELQPEAVLYQERELFDVVLHEIKAWLGKDLGLANLFLYDGRDRMLYHRATTSLKLVSAAVSSYEAVPQAANDEILSSISSKISAIEDVNEETKDRLITILSKLSDTQTVRRSAREWEADLRFLLTVLPQEPGTGVAGHTALTLIPEIYHSSPDEDNKWSSSRYSMERFGLMLSVEKMFGIGTFGSMAAVPLIESGQLAGVLFVVRDEPFSHRKDLPIMMEKAAQISPLLTMYRSRKFQHALMVGASRDQSARIGTLAALHAPLAFNTLLTVLWHISGGSIQVISLFGFDSLYSTYGLLGNHDPNREMWRREVKLKNQIHAWAKNRQVQVLRRTDDGTQNWGLPNGYTEKYEAMIGAKIDSAVVTFPPSSEDVLVMYFSEDPFVTQRNLLTNSQKLFPLYAIERLRERPKKEIKEIIGESPQILKALKELTRAARTKRITMLQGPTGSGKTLFAEHFHALSGREGRLITFRARGVPDTLMQDHLFGHSKGAFGGADADQPGLVELANGGTLFIDDFDTLSPETQEMLLHVVESKIVKRLGENLERKVDFLLLTATNRGEDDLMAKVRPDLIARFADKFIELPRLEERRMDIPLLLRNELTLLNASAKRLDATAWLKLLNANWPWGVRPLISISKDLSDHETDTIRASDIKARLGFEPLDDSQGAVELLTASLHTKASEEPLRIDLFVNEHTYRPNRNAADDWSNFAARAFCTLMENQSQQVRTYFSMGCGTGLDAIAAHQIFGCNHLIIADVHPEVIAFARENILLNCERLTLSDIKRYQSDLFSNIPDESLKADLIYENLPNLVHQQPDADILSQGHTSATYLHQPRTEDIPKVFRDNLLELHYAFLLSAKKFLSRNGFVVCSIGARVGWNVIAQMFTSLGYDPELLVFDLKVQEEAEDVVQGYAKAEGVGMQTSFRFYPMEETSALLNTLAYRNIVSGFAAHREEVEVALEQLRLNAVTAKDRLAKNQKVGHMVYVVKGKPIRKR